MNQQKIADSVNVVLMLTLFLAPIVAGLFFLLCDVIGWLRYGSAFHSTHFGDLFGFQPHTGWLGIDSILAWLFRRPVEIGLLIIAVCGGAIFNLVGYALSPED